MQAITIDYSAYETDVPLSQEWPKHAKWPRKSCVLVGAGHIAPRARCDEARKSTSGRVVAIMLWFFDHAVRTAQGGSAAHEGDRDRRRRFPHDRLGAHC